MLLSSRTKPTFPRAGTSFIIDLTFVSSGLTTGYNWEVSETLDVEMVQTSFEDRFASGSAKGRELHQVSL